MAWWGMAKNPQHGGSLAETCASNAPAGLWLVWVPGACLLLLWLHAPWEHQDPHAPCAMSDLKPPGTAGLVRWLWWVWVGLCIQEAAGGSPALTPCCHPAVFPQCRHLPEGTAGGREAEEEGGEAEGDPQGPAHLPLAVGAVAGGGLRLAAGATPAGRGAALSLSAASGRCLVVVPFPFVPWILFRCLSLSLSGGWGKLRWGTPSPEPKHRREGSGAVPWAGQSAATHGGVGRGGHTAAEPRGEPGSPPFCSTGCSTLNVPPPSWVGWGAHHAKQPHDQCCFS